jgi:hypothetical protein
MSSSAGVQPPSGTFRGVAPILPETRDEDRALSSSVVTEITGVVDVVPPSGEPSVVDLVVNLVVDPIAVAAAHRGEEPRVVNAHDEAGRRV